MDGFKDESSRSRLNGREAVNIAVKKRSGENIIEITEQIDELIAKRKTTWPQGTQITKLMDQSKDIRLMVADLENNILSGLILVVIVLLFVMGFRNALLVGLAIPFSMLLSFAVLYALGITLNMVVLFSLTLALGMLVDNAIVIVENIYRYMEQGVPRTEAAMRATSEVAYPVIGSTLTTLAAFFPLIFWPGIMGEFMYYLPLTLVVTLTSSLLVALIINPALCSIFLKVRARTASGQVAKDASAIESAGEKPAEIKGALLKFYTAILRGALNHRITVTLLSFAILIILFQVWVLLVGLERPVEFFPSTDPTSIYVNIDPPEGAELAYTDQLAKTVEMKISGENGLNLTGSEKIPDHLYQASYEPKQHQTRDGNTFDGPSDLNNIEYVYSKTVQQAGSGLGFSQNLPNHIGVQFIDFLDRKTPAKQSIEAIRQRVESIAGAHITVTEQEEGPPTGMAINIEISGDHYATLGMIAKNVRDIINKIPFVEDLQDDYVEGIPSIQVKIDRQKAAIFGLSTNALGFALKIAYNGLDVSTFREGDEDYDITVTLPKNDRMGIDVLQNLMIPTTMGTMVPLTTLAKIDYTGSMGDISRINHNRTVTVKANVDETKIPGTVVRAQAEKILKQFTLPAGYTIKFTGEFENQQEAQAFLSKAFLIALFLIFLILVTLFNSAIQPVIIMTSVILSLGGAFLGLTVIRAPFGIIMSGVGVISLAGVVVNNAIVLIDYTNKLRQRGMQLRDALIASGATRLRPVLLTAVTTILGLLPMVTGKSYDFHKMTVSMASESTQFWQNMAIVVIFGLMIATFLTLIVVPTLYSLLVDTQQKAKSLATRAKRLYWKPFGETS